MRRWSNCRSLEVSPVGFVDSDAHVLENDETWDYLDPSERQYRPFSVERQDPETGVSRRIWLVGDTWTRRPRSDGLSDALVGKKYDSASTHLTDVGARLHDLDMLGIDVQILFSTFFLGMELDNPFAEAALTRSYNRFMAERTADSRGRLLWVIVPPTRLMDRASEELAYGKE